MFSIGYGLVFIWSGYVREKFFLHINIHRGYWVRFQFNFLWFSPFKKTMTKTLLRPYFHCNGYPGRGIKRIGTKTNWHVSTEPWQLYTLGDSKFDSLCCSLRHSLTTFMVVPSPLSFYFKRRNQFPTKAHLSFTLAQSDQPLHLPTSCHPLARRRTVLAAHASSMESPAMIPVNRLSLHATIATGPIR